MKLPKPNFKLKHINFKKLINIRTLHTFIKEPTQKAWPLCYCENTKKYLSKPTLKNIKKLCKIYKCKFNKLYILPRTRHVYRWHRTHVIDVKKIVYSFLLTGTDRNHKPIAYFRRETECPQSGQTNLYHNDFKMAVNLLLLVGQVLEYKDNIKTLVKSGFMTEEEAFLKLL